jgi:hypothetical protein
MIAKHRIYEPHRLRHRKCSFCGSWFEISHGNVKYCSRCREAKKLDPNAFRRFQRGELDEGIRPASS